MMQTSGNDFQPDSQNVSQIRSLDYLIREYPNEDLIPQFRKLQQTYPCYRAIRGDGNCFYRAIAFLYLREANFSRFSNVFQDIQNFCEGHSLQFEEISFKQKLKDLYNKYLLPLRDTFGQNRQNELSLCFNKSIVFDMIMVMYFRSLNYKYIRQHEQDFISFVTSRDAIQRVRKYGMDSEGIEYESMAKALNVQIQMKITDEFILKSEFYNLNRTNKLFEIFFRPGHFDLLYHKSSPYLQRFFQEQKHFYQPKTTPHHFDSYQYLQNNQDQRSRELQRPMQSYSSLYAQKMAQITTQPKIMQPQKLPIRNTFKNSLLSPFKSLSNLRNDYKKQSSKQQQSIQQIKNSQSKDKNKQKIIQPKSFSKNNSIPTQKYKPTEGQNNIDQRQPHQKVKQWLILILFFTGLGYICFGL